jgi:hypothetical protein
LSVFGYRFEPGPDQIRENKGFDHFTSSIGYTCCFLPDSSYLPIWVKEIGQVAAFAFSNVNEKTPLTSSSRFAGVERLGVRRDASGFSDNKEPQSKCPPLFVIIVIRDWHRPIHLKLSGRNVLYLGF